MKEIIVLMRINMDVEETENVQDKYYNLLEVLDICGFENGFEFVILDKETN